MKQNATNEFKDGLNLDLHPIVTPNTVLTDNLNGTFITYNGNEFCLQNDRGNKYVSSLTPGYTPIGIKEHNGILYIVSVNGNATEIGTFPSPNYPDSNLDYNYNVEKPYNLNLNKYEALHVLEDRTPLTGIDLGYTIETPVTIEIQDSYDGSVNLILVDGKHKPRIINSGFSVLPNNQYKFVNRKQDVVTNIYNDINKESELIRTSNVLTNVDLLGVQSGGQFKGGNYTFYIKFGDADYNQTDVVAESGIVSIFNGNDGIPSTISGTLADERTDKMIHLAITGLNHVYSKIYIYYSREYSDTQGYRITEYGMFNEPIDMIQKKDEETFESGEKGQSIWLTGFEQIVPINSEELNVDYHTIDWARAETQHSNMLFLGNVGQEKTFELYQKLKNYAKDVIISEYTEQSLDQVLLDYSSNSEYYSTSNIYHWLGYYPEEIYRFGIVFILKDGSKTPVFNVKGNVSINNEYDHGVFVTSKHNIISNDSINPIGITFTLPNTQLPNDVIGWFAVRQKRIPNTICEGLSMAIDKKSNIPVVYDGENWITQSFISCNRDFDNIKNIMNNDQGKPDADNVPCTLEYTDDSTYSLNKVLKEYGYPKFWKESNAILSLDPCVNSTVRSKLDGSTFTVNLERHLKRKTNYDNKNIIRYEVNPIQETVGHNETRCVYVPSNTGVKVLADGEFYEFSTIAGNGADTSQFKYFSFPFGVFDGSDVPGMCDHGTVNGTTTRKAIFNRLLDAIDNGSEIDDCLQQELDYLYKTNLNVNLLRGLYCPYIGIANNEDLPVAVYSIKQKYGFVESDYLVRKQDNSEYYCISKYFDVIKNKSENIFRGDCYTNTVTMRIVRNFIDATAPVSDVIIKEEGWQQKVIKRDINNPDVDGRVAYDEVNLSDVNTVNLGIWVTFKCLSSYNLGLRSIDRFHEDEQALLGSPRSFYPLNGASTATGNKMEESFLLNDGLSATVGRKRYNLMPDVPYSKSEFANRIMFSNIHITDAFTNGYRTFQGLAYKDYDKQYGAITKLISLGQNIFVVMEHGLGLVPVNPKALMQTTTGEAIHIYGYGVLPDEMTIISQDYGSKYEHSVIRTPIGIYGIDVDAKKIWRFSDKQGFETISDMKIETYLKDNLKEIPVEMGIKDIRAHYNGNKGDVMFTFYDENDFVKKISETDYFNVERKNISINVGGIKTIKCYTNLSDSDITFTNSNNLECSYYNKTLQVKGLEEGVGEVNINGIHIIVNVLEETVIPPDIPDEDGSDNYTWRYLGNGIYVYPDNSIITATKNQNITFYVKFTNNSDSLWYADWKIAVNGPIYWVQHPESGQNNATIYCSKVGSGTVTLMIRDKNHPNDETHESDLQWVNWSVTIKDDTT